MNKYAMKFFIYLKIYKPGRMKYTDTITKLSKFLKSAFVLKDLISNIKGNIFLHLLHSADYFFKMLLI